MRTLVGRSWSTAPPRCWAAPSRRCSAPATDDCLLSATSQSSRPVWRRRTCALLLARCETDVVNVAETCVRVGACTWSQRGRPDSLCPGGWVWAEGKSAALDSGECFPLLGSARWSQRSVCAGEECERPGVRCRRWGDVALVARSGIAWSTRREARARTRPLPRPRSYARRPAHDGDHGQIAAGVAVDPRWDCHEMFLSLGGLVDASVGALRVARITERVVRDRANS